MAEGLPESQKKGLHRAVAIVYCELLYGAGHWMRSMQVAVALAERFDVRFFLLGEPTADLRTGSGIQLVRLEPGRDLARWLVQSLEELRPAVIVLEYFPFGRHFSAFHLVPFLSAARRMECPPLLLTSLRDVLDHNAEDQKRINRRIAATANQLMHGILLHSDPGWVRLEDSFPEAALLTIPVLYTGYVAPPLAGFRSAGREAVILVSAGGGRECAPYFLAILRAYLQSGLRQNFRLRMVAGTLLEPEGWRQIEAAVCAHEGVEWLRWVPDLAAEMSGAAVSVSRCGYNTALDVLRTATPAVIIPSVQLGENEQSWRAARLAERGLWQVLEERAVDSSSFETAIRAVLAAPPPAVSIDCDGARGSVRIIEQLLEGFRDR